MSTWLWIGLVLLLIYHVRRTHARGEITFAPGEGVVKVHTPFKPKKVKLKFCGCVHVPGCSQLEDAAEVESLECDGFTIKFKIQSGIRVLKWRARA